MKRFFEIDHYKMTYTFYSMVTIFTYIVITKTRIHVITTYTFHLNVNLIHYVRIENILFQTISLPRIS